MFEDKCYLAPLSEYGNVPFRLLCQRYGANGTIVPLVSAKAIILNKKWFKELDPHPDEKFMGVQLFGGEPVDIQEAAMLVTKNFPYVKFIDINCGCPVPKITRRGGGAALMKDPEKIREIATTVSQAVSLPITVKTRIGLSPDLINISRVARANMVLRF